jgi:hypothetical protein
LEWIPYANHGGPDPSIPRIGAPNRVQSSFTIVPEDNFAEKDGEKTREIFWEYGGPRGGRLHAGIADTLDEAKAAWLYAWQGPMTH